MDLNSTREQHFAEWLFRAGIRAAKRDAKEDAHVLLTEGLAIDNSLESGWLWLAEVCISSSSKLSVLREACEVASSERTRSKLASLLVRLGQEAAANGDKPTARSHFGDAAKQQPQSTKILLLCASVSQDAKHAIGFLQQTLLLEPSHKKATAWLSKLESKKRKSKKRKSSGSRPKQTVLLVDDSSTIQRLVKLTLTRKGYVVELAKSGEQALKMLETTVPNLILLDINMPEMDGLEVLRRLKKNSQTSGIPVMMLTGKDAAADRAAGVRSGAVEYLVKPIKPDELEAAVARHVATKPASVQQASG